MMPKQVEQHQTIYLDEEEFWLASQWGAEITLEHLNQAVQLKRSIRAVDDAVLAVAQNNTDETVGIAVVFSWHWTQCNMQQLPLLVFV